MRDGYNFLEVIIHKVTYNIRVSINIINFKTPKM